MFVSSFNRSNVLYSPTLISHLDKLQSVSFEVASTGPPASTNWVWSWWVIKGLIANQLFRVHKAARRAAHERVGGSERLLLPIRPHGLLEPRTSVFYPREDSISQSPEGVNPEEANWRSPFFFLYCLNKHPWNWGHFCLICVNVLIKLPGPPQSLSHSDRSRNITPFTVVLRHSRAILKSIYF